MINLTENEKSLLLSFAYCLNGPTNGAPQYAESRGDLGTYLWLSDRNAGSAKSIQAKRAVLGSLIKKDLIYVYNDPDPRDSVVDFTETGFKAVMDLIK